MGARRDGEDIGKRLGIPKNSICRLARNARLRGDPRFPARTPDVYAARRSLKRPARPARREKPRFPGDDRRSPRPSP